MSVSSQTKGSAVEQLVWCEKRIGQLEDENDKLRAAVAEFEKRKNAVLLDLSALHKSLGKLEERSLYWMGGYQQEVIAIYKKLQGDKTGSE